MANTDVLLQVQQDGNFVPVDVSTSDERGEFRFDGLPLDEAHLYLPGATRDGVFYPGPRIMVGPGQPTATVQLRVHEAVAEPNPLVALRHEIVVRPEPGRLSVTESILVSNPSEFCYVGPPREHDRTVTLRLSVPSNFEKVTFHKEFFGRRFALIDGSLVTNIPWPPGERELAFTYFLPVTSGRQIWERPLDLACSRVSLRVVGSDAKHVACNLGTAMAVGSEELAFESTAVELPAGHMLRVELGRLQVPFMVYARWLALAVLAGLILAASSVSLIRRRLARNRTANSQPRSPWHRHAGRGGRIKYWQRHSAH